MLITLNTSLIKNKKKLFGFSMGFCSIFISRTTVFLNLEGLNCFDRFSSVFKLKQK